MTTWNIGNTTVRNPVRLLEGLRVFADHMEGSEFAANVTEQERFWEVLRTAGLIESDTANERGSLGRKWFSALFQLGFVRRSETGHVHVTAAGRALMDHPETTDLIFLRQLMKYKISSPLERIRLEGYHFRPFVTMLRFLELARRHGLDGLTRDEIALFVTTTMTEDPDAIALVFHQKIMPFRAGYQAAIGLVAKRAFVADQFARFAPRTPKESSLKDYADSNARYARIAGVVTQRGIGFGSYYKIADGRHDLVEQLLDTLPALIPDVDYVTTLHDPERPTLPLDDVNVIAAEIAQLEAQIVALGDGPAPGQSGTSLLAHHAQAQRLRERRDELNEYRFYRQQHSLETLGEIRELLNQIRTNTLPAARSYAPAFLEWALWRLLLAINDVRNPIAETRGFRVDDAFIPLHHAAPGAADCLFSYDKDALVVEATLTTSSRQVAAESEPVRRHVAAVVDELPAKTVRGLFVAKKIDPNTYDDFYNAGYRLNGVRIMLSIIPLTIDQIIHLINAMLTAKRLISSAELLILIRQIDNLRQRSNDGAEWSSLINQSFPQIVENLNSISR
jgi:hypothetical protein